MNALCSGLQTIVGLAHDPEWLSSQATMFSLPPSVSFVPCDREETAQAALESQPCSALLIDSRIGEPVAFAKSLRQVQPTLPILFIASQPYEEGEQFDKDHRFAAVVLDRLEADELVGLDEVRAFKVKILRTVKAIQLSAEQLSKPPRNLFVELSIGSSELSFSVMSESAVLVPSKTIEWSGRHKLRTDAELFRDWTLLRGEGANKRLADDWCKHLNNAGERILNEVFPPDLLDTIKQWVGKLDGQENIHYRFKVDDNDLMHVPFELIRHPTHQRRLREVSPVSREIAIRSLDLLRSFSRSAGGKPKVLCIASNVRGSLAIPNFEFGDRPTRWFDPLALEQECEDIVAAYGGNCISFPLQPGDTVTQLRDQLALGWDIVHFCGHSVRAKAKLGSAHPDRRRAFVVLPGYYDGGPLNWVSMNSFARDARDAGAQMVVLSSCESSSVEAIAEVASEGVPIGVGFRWEVKDTSAKEFSKRLHTALAAGEPIGRAFLRSLQRMMEPTRDRLDHEPAAVATMLVVQGSVWTSYAAHAADRNHHGAASESRDELV